MPHRFGLIKGIALTILVAIYPIVFLYSTNVIITPANSMVTSLLTMVPLALALFGFFWMIQRKVVLASLSTVIFLVFFHTYGTVFTRLVIANRFEVEHFTLLPFFILLAFYGAFFISKLNLQTAQHTQDVLLLVAGALVIYNFVIALPVEYDKSQRRVIQRMAEPAGVAKETYPDIYFIIFDEYAGFEALDEYWRYDGYKTFVSYLESHGFFVAQKSHSYTTNTLYEISSRLNLKVYTNPAREYSERYSVLFDAIADNKVMRLLKSYGYTTVVFDGAASGYHEKTPIVADYRFDYDASASTGAEEFTSLFYGQTMLRAVPNVYVAQDTVSTTNRKYILYSLEKATQLDEIPTPKFVYLHVMLPHMAATFDENGGWVDYKLWDNWAYYLPQHKYATKRAQQLVGEILSQSDANRPPVIILQSDHGARNYETPSPDSYTLQNYNEKYKTSILNAVLIPGYDYSQFSDDLSPVEPLKVILNHYFDAGVDVVTVDDEH